MSLENTPPSVVFMDVLAPLLSVSPIKHLGDPRFDSSLHELDDASPFSSILSHFTCAFPLLLAPRPPTLLAPQHKPTSSFESRTIKRVHVQRAPLVLIRPEIAPSSCFSHLFLTTSIATLAVRRVKTLPRLWVFCPASLGDSPTRYLAKAYPHPSSPGRPRRFPYIHPMGFLAVAASRPLCRSRSRALPTAQVSSTAKIRGGDLEASWDGEWRKMVGREVLRILGLRRVGW
ncbi:hypothetical protein BJ875DRAFT_136016 [Amylocarpus encephaloides]|uniref:Uncharacterized protein n=1 Tax=Amylocarpus encephaloides TaxID=45428 RepID=A0A9P8C2E6_9HELO|nr:hypothetical protein BJ875DRAFT_136016 [Amylocarpus encephaloides]